MTRFPLSIVIFCSIIFLGGCSHEANPKDVTDRLSANEAREVAMQYIKDRRATTDGWQAKWAKEDPLLGEGIPLFASRDDVPDQFLFLPTCSDSMPCGYIMLSVTGATPRIIELSEQHRPSLQPLPDTKLYLFSPFGWYRVPNNVTSTTNIEILHFGKGNIQTTTYDQFQKDLLLGRAE